MQQTIYLKLNKPDGTDSVDIAILNANMDTLDTTIKTIAEALNNISVPVQSVNTKTGAVVLSATDIKCSNSKTIQAELDGKAGTFNKSDSVTLDDSNTLATSKAVKNLNDAKADKFTTTDWYDIPSSSQIPTAYALYKLNKKFVVTTTVPTASTAIDGYFYFVPEA